MGLQNQLNDVATDSIPLHLIATVAIGVSHLRSIFLTLVQFLHLNRANPTPHSDYASSILADQRNINRILSHKFGDSNQDRIDSDCVVCLCGLQQGDEVRRLPCSHVFHKSCFEGWLDHLNFNCPLCRSPLGETRCTAEQRRIGGDAVAWFGVH